MAYPNRLILHLTVGLDRVVTNADLVTTDRLQTMMVMTMETPIVVADMVERIHESLDDGDMILVQVTTVTTLTMTVHLTVIILIIEREILKNSESSYNKKYFRLSLVTNLITPRPLLSHIPAKILFISCKWLG